MANHRLTSKTQHPKDKVNAAVDSSESAFQGQLQSLLQQKKYRQALEEIKKVRRTQPDVKFQPTEAEIWLLRGQQEFQKADLKSAENSFRQALSLGLLGEAHYWLAKSLVALNRLDAALDLIRRDFEQGTLPKEFAICYLKLLLLKGDIPTVEQLMAKQSKRFSAPQLHWVRGVLALKQGEPETALTSFQKIKRPLTPGDLPDAWMVYAQQASGLWEVAAVKLGLASTSRWGAMYGKPKFLDHPILLRLATWQQVKMGNRNNIRVQLQDQTVQEVMSALAVVQLIDEGNYHDAGHALLKVGQSKRFPELSKLRSPLLTLAGQQAFTQGETGCAVQFWQPLLNESSWNPQLAVNTLEALEINDAGQERQRLLTRLVKWIEQEAKRHPENWPAERLKLTLAQAHCRLADAWIAMGRFHTAVGAVQQAERLCPTSPEVLGRRGLLAADDDKIQDAIALLTQAIDGGCRYEEVYESLLNCWRELGNTRAVNETRRRYGKLFGDLDADMTIELEPWVEALATQHYPLYSRLVQNASAQNPAVRACQILIESTLGNPTSSGKIAFDQAVATQRWEALLQTLSVPDQIPVLTAIALSIQLFAKREKGIAALISQYLLKIAQVKADYPEARVAHLVILTVKENQPQKLQVPIRSYLAVVPQPGNALAAVQLQARFFTQTSILRSFLDEALIREPQNPLLLLAKATTFPPHSKQYEALNQQGFDLARRLQDAKALQAFRTEQTFLTNQETQSVIPDLGQLDQLDSAGMEAMLEAMIRRLFGNKIPRAELDRMLPELKQKMLNDMPNFNDDDYFEEDDAFDLDAMFGGNRKKRKRSFRDL